MLKNDSFVVYKIEIENVDVKRVMMPVVVHNSTNTHDDDMIGCISLI